MASTAPSASTASTAPVYLTRADMQARVPIESIVLRIAATAEEHDDAMKAVAEFFEKYKLSCSDDTYSFHEDHHTLRITAGFLEKGCSVLGPCSFEWITKKRDGSSHLQFLGVAQIKDYVCNGYFECQSLFAHAPNYRVNGFAADGQLTGYNVVSVCHDDGHTEEYRGIFRAGVIQSGSKTTYSTDQEAYDRAAAGYRRIIDGIHEIFKCCSGCTVQAGCRACALRTQVFDLLFANMSAPRHRDFRIIHAITNVVAGEFNLSLPKFSFYDQR